MGDSLEEVPRQVRQAEIARSLDDDSVVACANFFSFLLSQAAALEEAHPGGQALLYVQPQPSPSP